MNRRRWVSQRVRCELLRPHDPVGRWPGRGPWVGLTLGWRAAEPCIVTLDIPAGRGRVVRWEVARELLAAGLHGPAGLGDVSLFTDLGNPAYRELVFSSPSGRIALRVLIDTLEAFLDATWRVVPPHGEAAVLDAALTKLCGRVIS